jgi:Fe2+ transport system protein B
MANKVPAKLDIPVANSITVGEWLGITDRHVRRLASEGIIDTVSKGKYDILDCVKKYTSYLRQQNESRKSNKEVKLNYDVERALHEKVKRDTAELKLKVMKSDLHKAEDIEKIMNDTIANAREQLLSIPGKATLMVMGHTDIPSIQSILQKVVYETLEEIVNYIPGPINKKTVVIDESMAEEEE